MRIALVITELETGGAESCLTELAIYLAARGWKVRVFALGPPPQAPRDELIARLASAGVDVRFGRALKLVQLRRVLRWLRTELLEFAPDVVQSMLWHANVLSALALGRQRAKLVGGMRVSEPRRWRWPIERWCARRMSMMVCVSDDVRNHALLRQRLPASKLMTIPNGISQTAVDSLNARRWSQIGLPEHKHVLLFVGRLEPQKGVMQLADQLPQILGPLPTWQFVVMGQGSLKSPMQTLVKRSGLTEQVHFVPWQPQAIGWMLSSDVLLLPAVYEGMPNVLLEAMAVGKPVVAFAVDGVRQLLADDYPSELADRQLALPGDWHGFNERVARLASDAELRAACGLANREQVFKHFRLEDQLAKYEQLYRTLCEQGAM